MFSDYSKEPEFDFEFLNDFAKGDETGLVRLYNLYFISLLKCGLRIISDRFAVENIVQDAFLKAWSFRDRLNSSLHAFRFMRMNVKWACYDYSKQPENRWLEYSEYMDYSAFGYLPDFDLEEPVCQDQEMLKSIYEIMPYLPVNRQTILELYFKYGFSYKQIAKRYGSSVASISNELHEGLAYLKKIIHTKKQITPASTPVPSAKHPADEHLTGETLQLFKLRYENKLPFEVIAAKMNLPQPYVQQQYVAAHAKLKQLKVNRRP